MELYKIKQIGSTVQAMAHQYNYADGSYYVFAACGVARGDRLCLSYGSNAENSNQIGSLVLRGCADEPHALYLAGWYGEIYVNGKLVTQPIALHPDGPMTLRQKLLLQCNPYKYLTQKWPDPQDF